MSPTPVELCVAELPTAVKIGAYDWDVTLMYDDGPDSETLCGQADFEPRKLRIWPKNLTSPAHAAGIVLHECLHVIFDNQGLEHMKRGKEDREEQIVLAFEAGLIALYRDNPRLLAWMTKWLSNA